MAPISGYTTDHGNQCVWHRAVRRVIARLRTERVQAIGRTGNGRRRAGAMRRAARYGPRQFRNRDRSHENDDQIGKASDWPADLRLEMCADAEQPWGSDEVTLARTSSIL